MPLARAPTSTFAFFALNGFVLNIWVVHSPEIPDRTGASAATLGHLLLLVVLIIGCVLAGLLAPQALRMATS